jgi:dolichol-phosphate mannosyltransferase
LSNRIVIVPTYNELDNINQIIDAVFSLPVPFDMLVVDDNSPDGTADQVKMKQQQYSGLHLLSRKGKNGLGTAYIEGFKWCIQRQYEYIFEMDADFSHNPNDLIKLYEGCTAHEGMTVGSRYVTGVNVVNWPMSRVMLSFFASKYVRFITGLNIHDTTAGFVCYHRKVLETINLDKIRFKGYAFQIEMKFTAWKHGFQVTEVPIIFTDRTRGQSKISKGIIKEAVWGVITMKIKSLFKTYKQISK